MTPYKQFPDNAYHDLYFVCTFEDGSTWSDYFKRVTVYKDHRPSYVMWEPTNRFVNSFLPGDDEMKQTEIKQAFKVWLSEKNPGQKIKVKWFKA